MVKASANVAAAQAFLAWLAGPDGQAILASFGFLPLLLIDLANRTPGRHRS